MENSIEMSDIGLYCLTDIHILSNAEPSSRPGRWLSRKEIKAAVAACNATRPESLIVKCGSRLNGGGTWANLLLTIKYIQWLDSSKSLGIIAKLPRSPNLAESSAKDSWSTIEAVIAKALNGPLDIESAMELTEAVEGYTSAIGSTHQRCLLLAATSQISLVPKGGAVSDLYIAYSRNNKAVKIGRSSNPARRVVSLSYTCHDIQIVRVFKGLGHLESEVLKHCRLSNIRGEWFNMHPDDACVAVSEFLIAATK